MYFYVLQLLKRCQHHFDRFDFFHNTLTHEGFFVFGKCANQELTGRSELFSCVND